MYAMITVVERLIKVMNTLGFDQDLHRHFDLILTSEVASLKCILGDRHQESGRFRPSFLNKFLTFLRKKGQLKTRGKNEIFETA